MDRLSFTGKPFPAVGFKRKMLDVVVASLLPMLNRKRLAVVLTVEISTQAANPARLTLVALCVDIGCLWRWDDSSLDLLAAGSTALVTVILIAALVGTLGTMSLG